MNRIQSMNADDVLYSEARRRAAATLLAYCEEQSPSNGEAFILAADNLIAVHNRRVRLATSFSSQRDAAAQLANVIAIH